MINYNHVKFHIGKKHGLCDYRKEESRGSKSLYLIIIKWDMKFERLVRAK